MIDLKFAKNMKETSNELLGELKDEVPNFPVIILTEVVEESTQLAFIDTDKVYRKKDFFKLEGEYSKEKVFSIFDSMKKYVEQRDGIELSIQDLKVKL